MGVGRHRDPQRHFGAGGLPEARRLCAEANRDLPGFVRPAGEVEVRGLDIRPIASRGRDRVDEIAFDSPLPSGVAANDRVRLRLYRCADAPVSDRVLVFHPPLYQRRWGIWRWFLAGLVRVAPVAILAAPFHFERTPPGEYAGESTVNANPWRLFLALRQWCWDERAARAALEEADGLRVAATIGFSLGAFQSLLSACAGTLDLPIVSIASTNRYAWGLRHGNLGAGTLAAMRAAGIDSPTLDELTSSLRLERHVRRLRGKAVFLVYGSRDRVDPAPSSLRLRAALRPTRTLVLPNGHASLLFHRRTIAIATIRFLEDVGALPPGIFDGGRPRRHSGKTIAAQPR